MRLRVLQQGGPGLAVTHPIRHPWVDTAGRLSFPSLLHWVPSQSSLVAVVAEALSELSGLQHAGPQSPQPSSSGVAFALTSAPRGTSTKQQSRSHLPRSHSFFRVHLHDWQSC